MNKAPQGSNRGADVPGISVHKQCVTMTKNKTGNRTIRDFRYVTLTRFVFPDVSKPNTAFSFRV